MAIEIPKPSYIKNLIITGQLTKLVVYIVTGVLVTIFVLLAFLSLLGIISFFLSPVDSFILAILSGTGLFGMYSMFHVRRIKKIDNIFPDFVRDLAESRRAGMTFTKAVLFAAKGNYGILTPEIERIAQQVSWGTNVNDALEDFARRVPTKLIRRTVSLIIEASKSGGNVADVLDAASRDAREIKLLESERKTSMISYVVVIYVGMFVFLAIVLILCTSFIPAMIGKEGAAGMQGIMGGSSLANKEEVLFIFQLACLVQAFGSAMVAGVFEDGHFSSASKHIFIMMFSAWICFKLLLGV
ncbi:MAG: type II secretion system F family protein [Candidatus Thermoplasmatota archaeon]